jgi:hypothetical protein
MDGHNIETMIAEMEASIRPDMTLEQQEAAEEALAKAARPKWTNENLFDVEKAIAAGPVGEVVPIDLRRVPLDPLTARITKVVEEELRRAAHRNDDREDEETNPDEQEPPEIPASDQVQADVALLKAKLAEGEKLWAYTSGVLKTDFARGKELRKALAHLCDERPALLDAE